MRTIERTIVGVQIVSADNKLLVALSAPGQVYPGCWKVPGGGVDEGETQKEAVIREVREETGLDVSSYPIVLLDDDLTGEAEKTLRDGERVLAKMTFFTYQVKADKPAAELEVTLDPHEFTEYRWIEVAELKNLKLSPPSTEVYKRLGYL